MGDQAAALAKQYRGQLEVLSGAETDAKAAADRAQRMDRQLAAAHDQLARLAASSYMGSAPDQALAAADAADLAVADGARLGPLHVRYGKPIPLDDLAGLGRHVIRRGQPVIPVEREPGDGVVQVGERPDGQDVPGHLLAALLERAHPLLGRATAGERQEAAHDARAAIGGAPDLARA